MITTWATDFRHNDPSEEIEVLPHDVPNKLPLKIIPEETLRNDFYLPSNAIKKIPPGTNQKYIPCQELFPLITSAYKSHSMRKIANNFFFFFTPKNRMKDV